MHALLLAVVVVRLAVRLVFAVAVSCRAQRPINNANLRATSLPTPLNCTSRAPTQQKTNKRNLNTSKLNKTTTCRKQTSPRAFHFSAVPMANRTLFP